MKDKDLPNNIPVFPLSSAIFFPNTILPLNIFEKRYIQLVNDCMQHDRLFGMVQPKIKTNLNTEVYNVGCLGKITNFNETSDKRFIINLSGISRFRIKEELKTHKLYREFKVDYSDFANDLIVNEENTKQTAPINIINKTKKFFNMYDYLIEFEELEKLNFDQMISTICMISPFSVEEKQKLVETIKIEDRMSALEKIIDFNLFSNTGNTTIQ